MRKKLIAVVIPTIRDLDILSYWKTEFKNCIGIIVEDRPEKQISIPKHIFQETLHYSWKEIDHDLGNKSWIIARNNSGIRNYGFLKAYMLGSDITITLDDDCYPIKKQKFIAGHVNNLSLSAPKEWFSTYPHRNYLYTRGFPYSVRNKHEVVISHGLWTNIIDLDAKTQLNQGNLNMSILHPDLLEFIPSGHFFPMCSMNLAFKTKITPIMYFPPMGRDNNGDKWGYDRFDDIWAGLFSKKIIDHLGFAVVSGSPFIEHRRKSNIDENIIKERAGMRVNETLFRRLNVQLSKTTPIDSYRELIQKIHLPKTKYFRRLVDAVETWLDICTR